MTPISTLVADPPWLFGDSLPGRGRGASKHYGCLPLPELLAFPLPPLANNAVLFLWRVASMQEEALAVVRAWGFVPKSEIVWLKRTTHGKRWFGMGRSVRAEHETVIIATRGRPVRRSASRPQHLRGAGAPTQREAGRVLRARRVAPIAFRDALLSLPRDAQARAA